MSNAAAATQVPPTEKTLKDIQIEYSNLCAKSGHIQFQVASLQKDLALVLNQIEAVNFEAAAFQRQQAEAAANAQPSLLSQQ